MDRRDSQRNGKWQTRHTDPRRRGGGGGRQSSDGFQGSGGTLCDTIMRDICHYEVKVAQLCPTLCNPMVYTSMGFSRLEYWSGQPIPSPGGLLNPGIEPRSPTLQADSFPAEPPGKPRYTGVGSLSFLRRIFPTWESNQGLLHCTQILYQLSYQESPICHYTCIQTTELQQQQCILR